MRVLVTRPEAEARATAERLVAAGHEALIEPVLRIVLETPDLPARPYRALLVTSGNALRALAAAGAVPRLRDVEVFAVGDRTARLARQSGFARVVSAEGDAAALLALVRRRLAPGDGPLLYAAGRERSGDVNLVLRTSGYEVDLVEAYRAEPVETLSPATIAALTEGEVDAVLLASRRSADAFLAAAERSGVVHTLATLIAACLSPAIADTMPRHLFRHVRAAIEPTETALIATLAAGR